MRYAAPGVYWGISGTLESVQFSLVVVFYGLCMGRGKRTVARQIHRHERESPLRMPRPHQPRPGIVGERNQRRVAAVHVVRILTQLRMIGHVKVFRTARLRLEALLAVPGHVLDRD